MRRWVETLATGTVLGIAAIPFIALFPEPPYFGRGAMGLIAAFVIPAVMGTAYRSDPARRRRILWRMMAVLAITVISLLLRIMAPRYFASIPTPDILPRLFGLGGEDIDDAVIYEAWLEAWLCCAAAIVIPTVWHAAVARVRAKPKPPGPWDQMLAPAEAARWNGATILLWLVGLAALGGAVVQGYRTASFLAGCVRVTGTIADPQSHPIIEFTAHDGVTVRFRQNGSVSREQGATVPVAYQTRDPAGTARADTFWTEWGEVLGFAWIGLGFTLAPFFGFRAAFRAGRP
ncbi:MAG: hypothetical protein EON55_16590 [Alphaproteobacteria bacterium]|nr:MAG: hypothetical protein EON55_16590 [Alphaproteobacteria bacterium]